MASHMTTLSKSLLRLIMLYSCFGVSPLRADRGDSIEIQFEPVGGMASMANGPDALFDMMAQGPQSTSNGLRNMRGPAKGGREAELDKVMSAMLGGMMQQFGPGGMGPFGPGMPPPMRAGGMGTPYDNVVMLEGPQGTEVIPLGRNRQQRNPVNSMEGSLLRELFPGPLQPMMAVGPHGHAFEAPDPIVLNMMQDMDHAFASDIMPAVHKASKLRDAPNSCEQDIQTKCQGVRKGVSHLQCLSYNHDSISEQCRKDIGKSVPFVCSKEIDSWCDVLQTGILSCLYNRMDNLNGKCKDAVLTTKHVISTVSTQKASVVDPTTGAKTVSTPALKSGTGTSGAATQREASLDAILGASEESDEVEAEKWLEAHPPVALLTNFKPRQVAEPKPADSTHVPAPQKKPFLSKTDAEANLDAKLGLSTMAKPKPAVSPSALVQNAEANLDAKLGLSTAAKPKPAASPSALVQKGSSLLSKPGVAPPTLDGNSSWQSLRMPLIALIGLTVVGFLMYMLAYQDTHVWTKAVRTAMVQQKGPEGIKLVSSAEQKPFAL